MPTATYTPLANFTTTTGTGTINITSISQNYRDLILIMRTDTGGNGGMNANLTINGNGSGIYSTVRGGANQGGRTQNVTNSAANWAFSTNSGDVLIFEFIDYSQTNKAKSLLTKRHTQYEVQMMATRIDTTSAITSIAISSPGTAGNRYEAGTTFALYGIAA